MSKDNLVPTSIPEVETSEQCEEAYICQLDSCAMSFLYGEDSADIVVEPHFGKNMSRAYRRKVTARRHQRSVRTAKILKQKAGRSEKSEATGYKRARILQPQCVELKSIQPGDHRINANFIKMFDTYEDYLDYLSDCYADNDSISYGVEVTGLRISEHPIKELHSMTVKADAYGKRVSCLYGKKKKDILAKSKNSIDANFVRLFDTYEDYLDYLYDCYSDNDCSSMSIKDDAYIRYINHQTGHFRDIIATRPFLKKTQIRLLMKQPEFIPFQLVLQHYGHVFIPFIF